MDKQANTAIFLRPAEAAQLLGVSRSKVYLMLRTGELPSRQFGSALRIPRMAIELMAQETVESRGPAT